MRKMITAVVATVGAATWWAGGPAAGHEDHGPKLFAPDASTPVFGTPERHGAVTHPTPHGHALTGPEAERALPPPAAEERQFAHGGGYTEYRHSESHVEGHYRGGYHHVPPSPVPPAPHGCHRPAYPNYGYDIHVERRHYRPRVGYDCGPYELRRPACGHGYGYRDECLPRPHCRRGLFGLDLRLGF